MMQMKIIYHDDDDDLYDELLYVEQLPLIGS
jgi:hypothetical protein